MLGVILIFVMGLCAGFLISDHIKKIWPEPKKKIEPEELSALIGSAVDAIRGERS